MLVKALVSFAGALTMYVGEVAECSDEAVLQDLIQAGYIEEVKPEGGNKDEGKRSKRK